MENFPLMIKVFQARHYYLKVKMLKLIDQESVTV